MQLFVISNQLWNLGDEPNKQSKTVFEYVLITWGVGNLATEALEELSPLRTAPNASASPILGAIGPSYPLWVGQRNDGNGKINLELMILMRNL